MTRIPSCPDDCTGSPFDLFALADSDKSLAGQHHPFSVHTSRTANTIILQWGHGSDATFRLIDNTPRISSYGGPPGRVIDRWTAENALSIRLP